MTLASINPATGETLRTFAELTDEQLEQKLEQATTAFERQRATPLGERTAGLLRAAEILDAEQELFTDRVNLVRAQHDEVVTEFDLGQQIGRLTAVDLKLPVEIYNFDTHYKAVRDKWIGFSPSD